MPDTKRHNSNPVQRAHRDNTNGESICLMFLTPGISGDQTMITNIYSVTDRTKYAVRFIKQSISVYLCQDKGMYHTQPPYVRVIS